MIPIYEQGDGRGIGHGLGSFPKRFGKICEEYREEGRTKSFAFIFYDFHNRDIRQILKDKGVFAHLDRLSGNKLGIFYLHASSQDGVERFNKVFSTTLGLPHEVEFPCVVFFRLSDAGFTDVAAAKMDSTDLIHGFHELYGIIDRYMENDEDKPESRLQFVSWIRGQLGSYPLRSCVKQLESPLVMSRSRVTQLTASTLRLRLAAGLQKSRILHLTEWPLTTHCRR